MNILVTPAQLLVRKSDQKIILANNEMAKLLETPVDKIIGRYFHDYILIPEIGHLEKIRPIRTYLRVTLAMNTEVGDFFMSVKEISGVIFRITIVGTAEPPGEIDLILNNSEIFYQLIKFAPIYIFKISPDLRVQFVNKVPSRLEYKSVIGSKITKIVSSNNNEFEAELRNTFNTQLASSIDVEIVNNEYYNMTIFPYLDSLILFASDQTNVKRIEGELFDLSFVMKTLLDASPLGVAILINETFIFSNTQFDQFLEEESEGKSINEISLLRKLSFSTLLNQEETDESVLELERPGEDGREYFRLRYRKIKYFEENAFILHTENISNFRQIQLEREQLIKQREELNKLESLGLLAGGIAHDFNNILTGIIANGSLLEFYVSNVSDEVTQIISDLMKAADQAKKLTQQLLSYTGRAQITKKVINLGQTIQSSISLITNRFTSNVIINMDLIKDVYIFADETQINQIMINLVTNAIEAMPHGGTINVAMSLIDKHQLYDAECVNNFILQTKAVDYIQITVKDTGIGIKANHIKKIFNPFFTSKLTGKGLGLAVVLGIVESSKGGIRVDSSSNGTTFTLYLPHFNVNPQLEKEKIHNIEAQQLIITNMLVVDDNNNVLRSIAKILNFLDIDYDLLDQPQLIFPSLKQKNYDMILLDLTMPNHDTFRTVNEIIEQYPNQQILLSSGFPYSETEEFTIKENIKFLQKPYSKEELIEKLAEFQLMG